MVRLGQLQIHLDSVHGMCVHP
jgi:hypothetical protein